MDEVFYTKEAPPLPDPTTPIILKKKRKRHGKFKQLEDELQKRVIAVAEKIKRIRHSNINGLTIKGGHPNGQRHTAID